MKMSMRSIRNCSNCRFALPTIKPKLFCYGKKKHKKNNNVGGGCNSWKDFDYTTQEIEYELALNGVLHSTWNERVSFEKGREHERARMIKLMECVSKESE